MPNVSFATTKTGWPAWLGYCLIFFTSFGLFLSIQAFPSFPDPDTFYHTKMALLMKEQLLTRDFPWLPFTTLGQNFADHHYLYHVFLIPFLTFFGPFVGMKIATAFFAALAIVLFYGVLRVYRVRYALWYAFLFMGSGGFLFRLNLGKTSAISLCALFLAMIFWEKKKEWSLFALSWAYVWLYGGWPIVWLVAGSLGAGTMVASLVVEAKKVRRKFFLQCKLACKSIAVRLFAVVGGSFVGVLVNPFFPNNLRFYWEQTVQIAVVNYQKQIGVGMEWYPASFKTILGASTGAFVLFFIALLLFVAILFWEKLVRAKKGFLSERLPRVVAFFLLSALFLILTLRSQRHIEYFVPFFTVFAALCADTVLQQLDMKRFFATLRSVFWGKRVAPTIALLYLVALVPWMVGRAVINVRNEYRNGIPLQKYAGAASWMKKNIPENGIVFHSDWDDFPMLFFYDSSHRYIAGLDPTFLYRRDPVRYWQWANITTGVTQTGAVSIIKESFSASAIFIEKDHSAMQSVIARDTGARLVYEDSDAWVYEVK